MLTTSSNPLGQGRSWQGIKHISSWTFLSPLPSLLHIYLLCQLIEDVINLVIDGSVLLVLQVSLDLSLISFLDLRLEAVVELSNHQVKHFQAASDVGAESGQIYVILWIVCRFTLDRRRRGKIYEIVRLSSITSHHNTATCSACPARRASSGDGCADASIVQTGAVALQYIDKHCKTLYGIVWHCMAAASLQADDK